ncbi:MAG: heavy metal translocating P-type ATPase [Planctomycetales bacterium]|nr:heavy metal translocating P-type ATPase [Planctomycetales bacterium]
MMSGHPALEKSAPESYSRLSALIAAGSVVGIALHLLLRYGLHQSQPLFSLPAHDWPLLATLVLGGIPMVAGLVKKALRGEFGSDLLAGISIITAVLLGEYLAGAFVVLMLSGGDALESYAVRSASSVLDALARRVPSVAHRKSESGLVDVPIAELAVGDELVIFPHEICPVDGTVVEGRGTMDEAYLTGEPYLVSKAVGAHCLSGAINGNAALTIRADRLAIDSRYAKIMQVMRESEQRRPRLRRLGDQLGAYYTPLAVVIALLAWLLSGEATRFLAVLVVATPCPLIIAIPVAIIGSISLAARRGIIIKDPAVLERVSGCRTAIFDKTGTLTYGEPSVSDVVCVEGCERNQVLSLVASLERYSRHPLAGAILKAAETGKLELLDAAEVHEEPGAGLVGIVDSRRVEVTSRKKLLQKQPNAEPLLPPRTAGLECVVVLDGKYAATIQLRDQPRPDGEPFIHHLGPSHHIDRLMLVSGDRESEVQYLADLVGIGEVFASQTPEQKLALVKAETAKAPTLYLGDGINDAPAMTAATVGVAFGASSDITAEAAGAVIMNSTLESVDDFLHISRRMRSIALQSAVGGMVASIVGMLLASAGYLPPVAGAILQEVIDVVAVLNALRAAWPPKQLADYARK